MSNTYIKGRQQPGQKSRPPMSDDEKKKMRADSMAILEVQFHNSAKPMRFWSKCGQRKHRNINDAVNYLMWMINNFKPWQGMVSRAAIFDARSIKDSSSANKLYQYENKRWELIQPITW